jgi:TPR repeat protein
MRANGILIVFLLTLTMDAFAGPRQKHKNNLLKRCSDGIAVACYDYGVTLSRAKNKKERQKSDYYVRRACTLAYQPACKQKISNIKNQTVVSGKRNCDMAKTAGSIHLQGDVISFVEQDSPWYRAGAQADDKVISINDKPFAGYNDITEALGTGSLVLNVDRGGKLTSLMVNCP